MKTFWTNYKTAGLGLFVTALALAGCTGNVEAGTIKENDAYIKTEQTYTYEDFEGFYSSFTSDDKSEPDMMMAVSDETVMAGWRMSEYETMEVLEQSIEGNTLTIEFYQPADGAYNLEEIWGSFQLVLVEDEDGKKVITETGEAFYFLTEEEAAAYEYNTDIFFAENN